MNTEKKPEAQNKGKKFLGIHFRCCNIYNRVYVNDAGTAYEGACPRCHKHVHVAIGEGGSSSRFFEAR